MQQLDAISLQLILKSLATNKGHAFTYNYDMTDPWSHIIDVISIRDGGEHAVTRLTGGARAGIPEVDAAICTYSFLLLDKTASL